MAVIATISNQTFVVVARYATQYLTFNGVRYYAPTDLGVVRVFGSGDVDLGSGWWDLATIVDGAYSGPPFSGATGSSTLDRYRWEDAENTSASIHETREFYRIEDQIRNLAATDYLVEYRDKNLVRQGAIPTPDLKLKFQPVFNGVGTWTITLPAEHRAVPYLRAPGSGIIITNRVTGKIEISGPSSKPSKKATSQDPKGMVTISGLSDDVVVFDSMSFPDPSNPDVTTQQFSHDNRTGTADEIMRAYVASNIGPAAPAGTWRRKGLKGLLTLGSSPVNPGPIISKSPRFQNLGELLTDISLESGGTVAFRVVQVGDYLEFQTYNPSDRTKFIRLDIANGTLSDQSVEFAPPELTRVIVAGQGQMTDRHFIMVSTDDSTLAEDDWGRVIEKFKDQRNTDDETEMINSGLGLLNDKGYTKVAVKATPANDMTMVFMKDFFLGDKVTVVIDGQETKSYITEGIVSIDSAGLRSAVAIGDIADFDSESALRNTVQDNTRRIEFLEKNAESPNVDRLTLTGRGTTAERDDYYGAPVTLAQQVALANKKAVWFNADLGWEESYYAPTGSTGLSALGLIAGAPAGWYPTGRGPECILEPTAQIATPSPGATSYVQGWAGTVIRHGGAAWFTNNFGALFCNVAGYYDLRAWTIQETGGGTMNYHLVILNNAGTAERTKHDGGAFGLNAALYTTADVSMDSKFLYPGDQLLLRAQGGGPINVHVGSGSDTRGQLIARYVRPPLVSD